MGLCVLVYSACNSMLGCMHTCICACAQMGMGGRKSLNRKLPKYIERAQKGQKRYGAESFEKDGTVLPKPKLIAYITTPQKLF